MIRRLLLACVLLLFTSPSFAYVYNGHRFPGNQALYYVNLDSCASAMPWLDPVKLLADVQAAADGWRVQTNADFTFVYAGQTSRSGLANDGVSVVSCDNTPSPESVIAQTYWWFDGTGYLTNADILIHPATYPQYPFLTSDQSCSAGLYLLDILIHEFGHMLSLAHSSLAEATMYAPTSVCSTRERSLAADDITAIEMVYGTRSTTTTTPPPPDPTPTPVTECPYQGVTYPLGATLTQTMKTGQVSGWLAARDSEGWVLLSSQKVKSQTTVTMECGGA